jgi:two-component system response regulator AtoC
MLAIKPRILIADDDTSLRESLKLSLSDKYHVLTSSDGKDALNKLHSEKIDLILLDIKMPEVDGIEILRQVKAKDPLIEVLMLTGDQTVSSAVAAMKLGAFDYITKPFDIDKLLNLVEKALERGTLIKEHAYLKAEAAKEHGVEGMVGVSPQMQEIFKLIEKVSSSSATVLIQGETGTGKELVAHAIHNQSDRKPKLFVPVNCAAIPENLIESELFGHEKGAFTGAYERKIGKFEIASGGTIFLDEIGSMPLSLQAKLLRVLQEREIERVGGTHLIPIDVRIIAATNTDLKNAVSDKTFRDDLFYRINVVIIRIPPLRERKADIPALIDYFLKKFNEKFGRKIKGFSSEAFEVLGTYNWPGNVREVQNIIERLVALEKVEILGINSIPKEILEAIRHPATAASQARSFDQAYQQLEAEFIRRIIHKAHLKDRQIQALEYMYHYKRITKDKYMKVTSTTKTTAFRDLSDLVEKNIIKTHGIGKSTFYTLVEE